MIHWSLRAGIGAWALALTACPPTPVTPPPGTDCAAACAHGRDLGCEWAASTPAGATCEDVCLNTEASGYATMHPACLAVAKDCAEAERVSREGCE